LSSTEAWQPSEFGRILRPDADARLTKLKKNGPQNVRLHTLNLDYFRTLLPKHIAEQIFQLL